LGQASYFSLPVPTLSRAAPSPFCESLALMVGLRPSSFPFTPRCVEAIACLRQPRPQLLPSWPSGDLTQPLVILSSLLLDLLVSPLFHSRFPLHKQLTLSNVGMRIGLFVLPQLTIRPKTSTPDCAPGQRMGLKQSAPERRVPVFPSEIPLPLSSSVKGSRFGANSVRFSL